MRGLLGAILSCVLLATAAVPARADENAAATVNLEKQTIRRGAVAGAAEAKPGSPSATTAINKSTKASPAVPVRTSGFDALRVATSLAVVIVLILLMRWVAKRYFGVTGIGRASRAVQVLSRAPLTPRQHVMLLRVGRRVLVVADGGGQLSTLSEITDGDEVASLIGQLQEDHTARAGVNFGSLFSRMRGKYDPDAVSEPETERAANLLERRLSEATGDDDGETEKAHVENDDSPAVAATRRELSGLMDKVRLLSRQFKGS